MIKPSMKDLLIDNLCRDHYIKSPSVIQAFQTIPREQFVPTDQQHFAYDDRPLRIGDGQTISAPHMVAMMAEALDVKTGNVVLEIGTGSGYHAAIISQLVGQNGHVYTVERFSSLAHNAEHNLEKTKITNVTVIIGDGSVGLPSHQPYDRIYVTCAAPSIPQPLIDQLKDGGKLLLPVGSMYCDLILLEKKGNEIDKHNLGGCVFVPLVGKYGH